jgi:hypothetical protein
MPKRLNSVSLSNNVVNVISAFCEREDISEAAFSRKFDKNNRWTSDLRRGRSMSLRTPEEAARMCVLLQTTPEEILVEEADIELVRSLIEQEREKGIKKDPIPKDEAEDSETAELREIWSSADENERRDLLEMARMLKSRRKQNG